jgi:hypothetical protein
MFPEYSGMDYWTAFGAAIDLLMTPAELVEDRDARLDELKRIMSAGLMQSLWRFP